MHTTDALGNTFDELTESLKSRNPYQRRAAVEAISVHPGAGEALFDRIEDSNPHVRAALARCARRLEPDMARGILSVLVADTVAYVVLDALESIGSLVITELDTAVIAAATLAPDPRVRAAGVRACGMLGVAGLEQIVTDALADPNRQVRARAAEVARATESAVYAPILTDLLDTEASQPDVHEGMIANLAQAVAVCGTAGPRTGDVLGRALLACTESKPFVAKAITRLRTAGARPALETLLTATAAADRALAVRTLGEIGLGDSADAVRALGADPDPIVVHAVLRALGGGDSSTDNAVDRIRIAVRCITDGAAALHSYSTGSDPLIAGVARDALDTLEAAARTIANRLDPAAEPALQP